MTRKRGFSDFVEQRGAFGLRLLRRGKLITQLEFPNASTVEGRNYLLNAAFRNSGTTANWYLGLIAEAGYSAVSAADTALSHSGWDEFTDYDETTRQTWNKAAASSSQMQASSESTFTISAVSAGTYLKGAFVASASGKSATTGVLWATGIFAADIPVQEGDILNLSYYTTLSVP